MTTLLPAHPGQHWAVGPGGARSWGRRQASRDWLGPAEMAFMRTPHMQIGSRIGCLLVISALPLLPISPDRPPTGNPEPLPTFGRSTAPSPGEPRAGSAPTHTMPQITFKSSVDMVRLDVVVAKGGRPVTGLTESDFEILDNGVRQQPEVMTNSAGVTVLFVLDTSGSVSGDRLGELVDAAQALTRRLRATDSVGLLSFSDRPRLQVPVQAGPRQRDEILSSLQATRADGRTAMYDAIIMGLRTLEPASGGSLLLLFSDSEDTASQAASAAVLEVARRSEAVVGVVATSVPGEGTAPTSSMLGARGKFLRSLVEATGGPLLHVEFGRRHIEEAFSRLLGEFRSRYVLSYTPRCVGLNDGWHTLKVRVGPGVGQARARAGYYAAGAAAAAAPCGNDPDRDYAGLVRRYRSGDHDAAVRELAAWNRQRVRSEVARKALPPGPSALAAALLLHTEVALRQRPDELAKAHLTVAQGLVDALRRLRFDSTFRRTWYLVAESYLRVIGGGEQPRLLSLVSDEFPDDPEVHLALGSAWEAIANVDTPSAGTVTERPLSRAEREFRTALEADPTLVEARLRLGRVLHLAGRHDQAAAELERVGVEAKEHYVSYLAALFLGQIHERAGRLPRAAECYRAALATIPEASTASAALAHLQGTGGPLVAADWALTAVMRPDSVGLAGDRGDPWFLYRLGQYWRTTDRIARMRNAVVNGDAGDRRE